jgi:hypothetical protein
MNSSSISKLLVVLIGLMIGIWGVISTVTDTMSGGLGPALKLFLAVSIPLLFVKPRAGMYVLVAIMANIEWLKRLAVYNGVASVTTVTEMLVLPIVLLGILVLSMFAGLVFGATRMNKYEFGMFVLSGAVMATILVITKFTTYGAQAAFNSGLYLSVLPILTILMRDSSDFLKFMRYCAIMFLPWAVWGIKQYYTGLSAFEMYYVNTWLSPVLSNEVLTSVSNPRPFGLAGSQASYGAISFLAWFTLWHTIALREKRVLMAVMAVIFFAAVVLSGARTTLILVVISFPIYFLMQSKAGVALMYSTGAILLGLGIIFSTYLLNNLQKIQDTITVSDGGWAEKTLRVTTYSDRLRGWERLKNPDAWSLFGKRLEIETGYARAGVNSADYAHDLINAFLINVGAVGLLVVMVVLFAGLYNIHGIVFKLPKGSVPKKLAAAALAFSIPNLFLGIVGGGNFNTTPVNFFIWSFFAIPFIVRNENVSHPKPESNPETSSSHDSVPIQDRRQHRFG